MILDATRKHPQASIYMVNIRYHNNQADGYVAVRYSDLVSSNTSQGLDSARNES
jgi:hypothetical protein